MKPQTAATLALLRERPQGVTAIDALSSVGSFRLAARIAELKAMGYVIHAQTIRTASGKRIARYVLEEQMVVGL
jgi:helix-turn-helix protein